MPDMENIADKKDLKYAQWYESVYPRLSGYGTWLRGGEINTLPADEYRRRQFRVLFARLSTYADVSASFTHQLLYQIAASLPDVFPDLAYLPPEKDAKIFSRDSIPWLLGTQTKFGPEKFQLIGFSNSIIQELLNIPGFLAASNIPLSRKQRLEREDVPLIILGGSNALFTSSIWGEDSWIDGIFIGQDYRCISDLLRLCARGHKDGKPKLEILAQMRGVPGFYAADKPEKSAKAVLPKPGPDNIAILANGIVPYNEENMGAGFLQISQGCRALCGFCAESWMRKPYFELEPPFLLEKALQSKAEMGLEKIDLYSFNFNLHTGIYRILWDCSRIFKNVGIKSQRFDMLALDPGMIEYQLAFGKSVFSCGLEGISPRMRCYLNKNLNEEALYRSLDLILRSKCRELKVFLLCTGLEDESDLGDFGIMLGILSRWRTEYGSKCRIIFSVTPLVRFPWTPLEFDKAFTAEAYQRIIRRIEEVILEHEFEARQAMDVKEYFISQVLARAAHSGVRKALLAALNGSGFVYYRRITGQFFELFRGELKRNGMAEDELLEGSSFDESLSKPWSCLDTGIKKGLLWDIYRKNVLFQETGDARDKVNIEPAEYTVEQYRLMSRKIREDERKLNFAVSVSERGRGVSRKYFGLALARALMKSDESLVPYFRSYVSSHWSKDQAGPAWICGEDVITLSWDKEAVPALEGKLRTREFMAKVNSYLDSRGCLKRIVGAGEAAFRLSVDSPFAFKGAGYFKRKFLRYELRKKEEGVYFLEFSKDSLKKKIMTFFSYALKNAGGVKDYSKVLIELVPGSKFNPEEFVKEAFAYPGENEWVRTRITASSFPLRNGNFSIK